MPPPERPRQPKRPLDTQAVVEGARKVVQQSMPPVESSFSEDIVREIRSILPDHTVGACELGPYVEGEDQSAKTDTSGRLGGQPRPIAFDGSFWLWFSRLTPERRDTLIFLATEFRDRDRQTAMLEVVDERIERRVLRNFLRRLWHAAIAAIVISFAGAHWFSEQIGWIVDKIPAFKALWNLVSGARN